MDKLQLYILKSTFENLPDKWGQENSMPYFMEGKAAFCIGGDWNINQFQKALNYNIGVCEIPKLERECKSNGNANYLYVSKYANSMKNLIQIQLVNMENQS